MNWKINDITLFIKHKLSQENNNDEYEEKIDYKKFKNSLKEANIETLSVQNITKPLQ